MHNVPIRPPPPPKSHANLQSANPTYGVPRGPVTSNVWQPAASEYRASELNFVPKKISVNKKKNPFKILEALAEAQAEGHELRPHVIKKVRPSALHDDDSDSSDYVPDYMMVDNNPRYGRDESYSASSDEDSGLSDSSSKADLIYVAPQNKYKKKHGSNFHSSRDFVSPSTSLKKKTKVPQFEWNAASGSSSSSASSDSEYEPEHRQQLNDALRKIKSSKPKRMSPTLGPSEDHIDILQRSRKRNPITNYTKYKNRLNGASSLNTSI